MCESHLKCKKLLTNSILAFEKSRLNQLKVSPGFSVVYCEF